MENFDYKSFLGMSLTKFILINRMLSNDEIMRKVILLAKQQKVGNLYLLNIRLRNSIMARRTEQKIYLL